MNTAKAKHERSSDVKDPRNQLITPPWLLDVARASFGQGIVFDPMSSATANQIVQAQWYGSLDGTPAERYAQWLSPATWLNPPYGRGLCTAPVKRLCAELIQGEGRAIILTNFDHSTEWCKTLLRCPLLTPVFLFERVRFHDPVTLALTKQKGEKPNVVWVSEGCDLKPWVAFGSIWERVDFTPEVSNG